MPKPILKPSSNAFVTVVSTVSSGGTLFVSPAGVALQLAENGTLDRARYYMKVHTMNQKPALKVKGVAEAKGVAAEAG